MENPIMSTNNNESQRPVFLTVLCILTFISSGMGALSALTTPMFADVMVDMINTSPLFDESMKPDVILLLHAGWGYYLSTFVFSAGSLAGAIMMWNLRKIGFHFYAISNLGTLFLPTLFLNMPVGFGGVLFTLMFIGFYAIYFKLMK